MGQEDGKKKARGRNLGGKKFDTGKAPMDMIGEFSHSLGLVSKVMRFGADKYGKHNWKQGMLHSRLYAAALRHIFQSLSRDEPDEDEESGIDHLAHAQCCISMLLEMKHKGLGIDDREEDVI